MLFCNLIFECIHVSYRTGQGEFYIKSFLDFMYLYINPYADYYKYQVLVPFEAVYDLLVIYSIIVLLLLWRKKKKGDYKNNWEDVGLIASTYVFAFVFDKIYYG